MKTAPDRAISLGGARANPARRPGLRLSARLRAGAGSDRGFRTDHLAYANACHVAEVEVDIETGAVRVLRYFALHDSGVRINPMIVDGQTHGSIAHGIGNALFEWMGYDDARPARPRHFADYLIPTATEVPRFETHYRESPSPLNPLGVKGAGEAGVIPASPAVMSAIENALDTLRHRITETPLLPARSSGTDCSRTAVSSDRYAFDLRAERKRIVALREAQRAIRIA